MEVHENASNQRGYKEYPDRSNHDRLGGCPSDALGSARRPESIKAAHQRYDEAENERLKQALHDIVVFERLIAVPPILRAGQSEREIRDEEAAEHPDEI